MTTAEARAQTLLRAYPRAWRDRYGDEFAALLADDIAERPRNLGRDLDVVRCALATRLGAGGVGAAVAVFAAAATSIWTQLASGVAAGGPDSSAVILGLATLSLCGLAIAAATAIGVFALARAIAHSVRRGGGRRLIRPGALAGFGAAAFVAGVAHLSSHSHVSAPPARWTWAATESISTYWIHPGRLFALPTSEVAWMLASPVAAIACLRGLRGLVALTGLRDDRRLLRRLSVAVMFPALVTAATWVVGSQHDPNAHLRAGSLDLALVAAMAIGMLTVTRRSKASVV